MGTKRNPGRFDCHAKAAPDEPLFTLLARDPLAPALVELWATARETTGQSAGKVREARDCAAAMRLYRHDPPEKFISALPLSQPKLTRREAHEVIARGFVKSLERRTRAEAKRQLDGLCFPLFGPDKRHRDGDRRRPDYERREFDRREVQNQARRQGPADRRRPIVMTSKETLSTTHASPGTLFTTFTNRRSRERRVDIETSMKVGTPHRRRTKNRRQGPADCRRGQRRVDLGRRGGHIGSLGRRLGVVDRRLSQ